MSLVDWENNFMLTWRLDCAISSEIGATTYTITNTKL